MDLTVYLKGIVIGFSIAAPVGPIGVLCIRRTLAGGRWIGLVTGLGAASADAIYGMVAGLGLTLISNFLIAQKVYLGLFGGAFLCYLGVKTILSLASESPASVSGSGMLGSYLSTFFLTLTNPMTILSFAAVFAGLGLANQSAGIQDALFLVTGVFSGSLLWWFFLSAGVSLLGQKLSTAHLTWVNRVSGLIILGFGLAALLTSL